MVPSSGTASLSVQCHAQYEAMHNRVSRQILIRFNGPVMDLYLLDGFKVGDEEISVVVGHLVLQHRHQPFQTQPSINVLLGKRFQGPVSLSAQPQGKRQTVVEWVAAAGLPSLLSSPQDFK